MRKILNITDDGDIKEVKEDMIGYWVPFKEHLSQGEVVYPLFSNEFCLARSKHYGISLEEYCEKMKDFLDILKRLNEFDVIELWFSERRKNFINGTYVLDAILDLHFKGDVYYNSIDFENKKLSLRFQVEN